jgi:acyl-CoA reductase-like NAD-dependent aldehyde dehydrogenase
MEVLSSTSIKVNNPIKSTTLYEIDEISDTQAKDYFDKAKAVQQKIQAMSVEARIAEVDKIRDYVIANSDFILDCIIAETGKARTDAFAAEVFEVTDVIDVYTKLAPKQLQDQKMNWPIFLMEKKSRQFREPLGTVLVITPWNFPFYQVIVPSLMSFLAGNATHCKTIRSNTFKTTLGTLFCSTADL